LEASFASRAVSDGGIDSYVVPPTYDVR
jgi:hypothetical protein